MKLLQVLVVLAVIAAVAAVAAGLVRGGLAEPSSSRPLVALPPDRPPTADDLAGVQFSLALRGYRMEEVDDVLTRLTAELARRDAELAEPRAPAAPDR